MSAVQFGLWGGPREVKPGIIEIPLASAQPLRYAPGWLPDEAQIMNNLVRDLDWEQRQFQPPGTFSRDRQVPMPRLECWYSLVRGRSYRYAGQSYHSRELPPSLFRLLEAVKAATGHPFDAVFCNLYRDGRDSIGFHADDEADSLGPAAGVVIASLSLGERRKFEIRHRETEERVALDLGRGDLLVMGLGTQSNYLHGIPKQPAITGARVNLTFRVLR